MDARIGMPVAEKVTSKRNGMIRKAHLLEDRGGLGLLCPGGPGHRSALDRSGRPPPGVAEKRPREPDGFFGTGPGTSPLGYLPGPDRVQGGPAGRPHAFFDLLGICRPVDRHFAAGRARVSVFLSGGRRAIFFLKSPWKSGGSSCWPGSSGPWFAGIFNGSRGWNAVWKTRWCPSGC